MELSILICFAACKDLLLPHATQPNHLTFHHSPGFQLFASSFFFTANVLRFLFPLSPGSDIKLKNKFLMWIRYCDNFQFPLHRLFNLLHVTWVA